MSEIELKEWKPISGFSNYECSADGEVRNKTTHHVLTPSIRGGYARVWLIDDHDHKSMNSVHRLVAQIWIPNPDDKKTVNHKNFIRNDNRVDNLEWATHKEQELHKNTRQQKKGRGTRPVWKCDSETGNRLKLYQSLYEACHDVSDDINSRLLISECARGKRTSACGFKWIFDGQDEIPNEKWKAIEEENITGFYVSDHGRIRHNTRIMKGTRQAEDGYMNVSIKDRRLTIHILVAKAFIDNPDNKEIVNHKDGDKVNNIASNLEWVTHGENMIHAVEMGLMRNVKKIVNYDEAGNILGVYRSTLEASKNVRAHRKAISECCNGVIKSYGENQLMFKFLDDTDDLVNKKVDMEKLANKSDRTRIQIMKAVDVFDKEGNLLETCSSKKSASIKYKTKYDTITHHCEGRLKASPRAKYIFKLHEE